MLIDRTSLLVGSINSAGAVTGASISGGDRAQNTPALNITGLGTVLDVQKNAADIASYGDNFYVWVKVTEAFAGSGALVQFHILGHTANTGFGPQHILGSGPALGISDLTTNSLHGFMVGITPSVKKVKYLYCALSKSVALTAGGFAAGISFGVPHWVANDAKTGKERVGSVAVDGTYTAV